jgi:hypothetical protein
MAMMISSPMMGLTLSTFPLMLTSSSRIRCVTAENSSALAAFCWTTLSISTTARLI